jgi:hypothetical protein
MKRPMVFAVQCPNPKCRKYMLVEEHEKGNTVNCLICKTRIQVGALTPSSLKSSKPTPPPRH